MKTKLVILLLTLVFSLVGNGAALAADQTDPVLPRAMLSGGATDSAAGEGTLHATLGQPVVGLISAGQVTLEQGFWHAESQGPPTGSEHEVYLPLVVR